MCGACFYEGYNPVKCLLYNWILIYAMFQTKYTHFITMLVNVYAVKLFYRIGWILGAYIQ